ncbi:MAG: hypothetical protein JO340_19710 [Acidobacteriaceae bacterium]|nr:hypothetical protein [Acidobacteriaceae bacterium]
MWNSRSAVDNRFPMALEETGVTLAVVNHQLGKPILYIGETAQLDFAIWNNSTSDLILQSGDEPSTLLVFLPRTYFTTAQRGDMRIALANWTFANSPAEGSLTLTYTGPDAARWKAGAAISFSVTNVLSTASPDAKNLQVNFDNIQDTPGFLQTTLPLISKPAGKPKLTDTLQVSLDNQGIVFVSTRNNELVDALPNTLLLNIKNSGSAPLYRGQETWKGDPKVSVTFVYGSTSGALAPDNDKDHPELGSAWKIVASLPVAQVPWGFDQPNPKESADPEWTLYPAPTNKEILGVGDQANVTFAFAPIISFTSVGHTQMTLVFSGFMQDENTPYEEAVFVLDINKQNPPPTRGLLNFSSLDPLIRIKKEKQAADIMLSWGMFDVAAIQLVSSYPGAEPYNKTYPIDAVPSTYPLGYDNFKFSVPAISNSTPIFFTLQSYDGLGGFLNSLQFTVFIDLAIFVDPRDGTVYPVIQVGTQLWLAANLRYKNLGMYYNNMSKYDIPYGRLYTGNELAHQPAGWRVPTSDDWKRLFDSVKASNDKQLYAALIDGGRARFNAQLGGNYTPGNSPEFQGLALRGYYWTSSPKSSDSTYVITFSSLTESISSITFENSSAASIRLVKDI